MMAEQHRAEIANAALTGPAGASRGRGAHPLDGAKRWAVRRNPVGPDRQRAGLHPHSAAHPLKNGRSAVTMFDNRIYQAARRDASGWRIIPGGCAQNFGNLRGRL